jgi:hypothetical protein
MPIERHGSMNLEMQEMESISVLPHAGDAQPSYLSLEHVGPSSGNSRLITATVPYGTALVVLATIGAGICLRASLEVLIILLSHSDGAANDAMMLELVSGPLQLSVIFFCWALLFFVRNRRTELFFDFDQTELRVHEQRLIPAALSCCCCADLGMTLAFADLAGAKTSMRKTLLGCCATEEVWCTTREGAAFRVAAVKPDATSDTLSGWTAFLHSLAFVERDTGLGPARPSNTYQEGPHSDVAETPHKMAFTVAVTLCAGLWLSEVFSAVMGSVGLNRTDDSETGTNLTALRGVAIFAYMVAFVVFLAKNRRTRLTFDRMNHVMYVVDKSMLCVPCLDIDTVVPLAECGDVFARGVCCACCMEFDVMVTTVRNGSVRLGATHTADEAAEQVERWVEYFKTITTTAAFVPVHPLEV